MMTDGISAKSTTASSALILKVNICSLALRGIVLFLIGSAFTLVIRLLQFQRNNPGSFHSYYLISNIFHSLCWLIPACGIAAVFVGLLCPCLDQKLGAPHNFSREWSSVMRCVALYVGINHVTTKLDFPTHTQLTVALGAMSIALWYLCDRSGSGLGLGVAVAVLAAIILQILIFTDACIFSDKDLLYLCLCIPCLFFCGGITIGNIGRLLAVNDYLDTKKKTD